ncbi:hypothetical protein MKY91_20415 [Alkalicoccobacillus gibsonii]|uniref:Uncharacterized protein n=1 Tax=Alkalicoccobacillus gibsonii TaxID=79881 RepID=A0ABU9VNQ9_9BACI
MSQAEDYLYKKYNNLENHIQGVTQPSTVIEQTLVDLISFFKSPDTQIFNLNNLYLSLKNEDLFNAINAITIFFMKDSGNMTDGTNVIPDLIKEEKIFYSTMLSKFLIEHGFESYSPQKVVVYAKRKMDKPSFNKIPQPDFYDVANKPYWFESTAAKFVEENKDKLK